MNLQKLLIRKINKAYGRTNLIRGINNCEKRVSLKNQFYYNNLAVYFNNLYINDDVLECTEISYETIEQLKLDNQHLKNPILKFLIELITFELDFAHEEMSIV